jgi:hypothetical protein
MNICTQFLNYTQHHFGIENKKKTTIKIRIDVVRAAQVTVSKARFLQLSTSLILHISGGLTRKRPRKAFVLLGTQIGTL